jgi:succinoglycan biosynthesis protein ExoA
MTQSPTRTQFQTEPQMPVQTPVETPVEALAEAAPEPVPPRGPAAPPGRIIIVIPTLNEARHIVSVIRSLRAGAARLGALIVVVDGGSTDETCALVRAEAGRQAGLLLLPNPRRLQAAAVNLAVDHFAGQIDWIIRVDAHAAYPAQYCETLLAEAQRMQADSVVVRMHARGKGFMQRNITAAQNAFFGNGGAAHRGGGQGRFVDHGHHALMRVAAFRAVGGYDEAFGTNEDAELDQRLIKAGYRIWLTGATVMDYFPRDRLGALARQYFRFGSGRCSTVLKHPGSLRPRHLILIALAPLACLAALAPLAAALALPLLLWLVACVVAGLVTALRARDLSLAFGGVAGAVMQMAWSFGFWRCLLSQGARLLAPARRPRRAGQPMRGEDQ